MGKPNWENRTLFHGDNLPFLRAMNTESVDLIATDPPFKKGRDFHATPDKIEDGAKFQDRWSWERDVHSDWLDEIQDSWPAVWEVIDAANAVYMRRTKKNLKRPRNEVGSDMGAFLCFMAVRLLAMKRILKPTGTIYLHCDHTASHYLKAIMDAIFGWRNFRNEIVWCYAGGGTPKHDFPRKHDIIFRYSKTKNYTYDPIYREYSEGTKQRGRTPVKGKYYERGLNPEGTPVNDWWSGVKKITSPTDPEKTGWPTQKSVELYSRIIAASSRENDIVLDPFAGCATTCVAAEQLGRRWVGIDIWEKAHELVVGRLESEVGLFGQVFYKTELPQRSDAGETAAQALPTIERRSVPVEAWQKMSRKAMFDALAVAQGDGDGLVLCAGCGRQLEAPFMELDHIKPSADDGENDISNRILLCRPCNGRKNANLTMHGLFRENVRVEWMQDEGRAKHARALARDCYERIRYGEEGTGG